MCPCLFFRAAVWKAHCWPSSRSWLNWLSHHWRAWSTALSCPFFPSQYQDLMHRICPTEVLEQSCCVISQALSRQKAVCLSLSQLRVPSGSTMKWERTAPWAFPVPWSEVSEQPSLALPWALAHHRVPREPDPWALLTATCTGWGR